MEIFVRSRKEMALRMNSRNARKNLSRVWFSATIRSLLLRTRAPKQRPQEMIPHRVGKNARVLTYDSFVEGSRVFLSQRELYRQRRIGHHRSGDTHRSQASARTALC